MSLFSLPVRRPVATAMFFLGLLLLGLIAWQRIPVELIPDVSGETLYVSYSRRGSEPEVVEREILLPLEAKTRVLPDVKETSGQVTGSSGNFRVEFKPGTDVKLRELDLNRIVAELTRTQPPGTRIQVDLDPARFLAGFAMYVQVLGMDDVNALHDLTDQQIAPRLASVEGVAQVIPFGGSPRELTIRIDPDKCAAMGINPAQVEQALAAAVRRLDFLGGAEDEAGRTAIVLDGRPAGPVSIGSMRISPDRAVRLEHVAEIGLGPARLERLYRVNGKPAVAMVVYQESEANLVRLGRTLRQRLRELETEFRPYGIEFAINFDASESVEQQIDRLKGLAASGFVIALVVLYLFLRQWRAVAVVAVAVPASLLTALALLFIAGQTLNVVTLFGLAVGVGMLVDNSIVVYEAVQRRLEHGADPDSAAEQGVRHTFRAILAATLTNAIVFLPIAFTTFEDPAVRALLQVLVLAILLPLVGSLVVAVGLVPLLARRLAAPAALARLRELRDVRERSAGLRKPDRARELFGGLITVALRRPGVWLTGVVAAVLFTVIVALPWVLATSANAPPGETDQVQIPVELVRGGSLERAKSVFEQLEHAALELQGVERVESIVREEGGSITVHLVDAKLRPKETTAGRVRQVLNDEKEKLHGVRTTTLTPPRAGSLSQLFDDEGSKVIVSGPDARQLELIAEEVRARAATVPDIGEIAVSGARGRDEVRVTPDKRALAAFGLTADQVLPALSVVSREGIRLPTGFTLPDGREIPITVRRTEGKQRILDDLARMPLATPAGVLPLQAVADVRRFPPPPTIVHRNGRRELEVEYRLASSAPKTGPSRVALENRIREAFQALHRPPGYVLETPRAEDTFSWFRGILIPVLLLLFAVLAVTFESLTLPVLVLAALPLTLLGSTWSLVIADIPADQFAFMGLLALLGLTINPAILLVDRMQQRTLRGGMSAGAAALAAVRERARPVLMTTATTVAGLWPLALVTGRQNEIWPPFATVVMGGLITSTLLTLLVIPVGFVFLNRLDRLFGRLGPWIMIGWIAATAGVMTPLIVGDAITSLTWQVLTTLLVAGVLLAIAVLVLHRPTAPEPRSDSGPPVVEVRNLRKVYGIPGPIGRAWRAPERFAQFVMARGGRPFDPADARALILPYAVAGAGVAYLAFALDRPFFQYVAALVAAALLARSVREIRRSRGNTDPYGRVSPGGVEGAVAVALPWTAVLAVSLQSYLLPVLADQRPDVRSWVPVFWAVLLLVTQLGRRTARRVAAGEIAARPRRGLLRRPRAIWRSATRFLFGLDFEREQVQALVHNNIRVERGMVGVLGPNGAGKTTLLRILAGILDPTRGVVSLGGVPLHRIRRHLARYVGYLPQDFGLPQDMTAREYLDYFALLYEIRPAADRRERVDRLLDEVGLGERADEKIGGYSGGMRQRVAVARTLLRLPPIIIVDEPTVGLDPRERIRFRNLLSRLAEGRVVLFSTHVVEDVEVACERVIVLAEGRTVFDGPPERLADAARDRVWTITLTDDEAKAIPDAALVVDQVPEASGWSRCRILSASSPHEQAELVDPSLEDGYLWLVHQGAAA